MTGLAEAGRRVCRALAALAALLGCLALGWLATRLLTDAWGSLWAC
jgi:TRAP-type C4-dicarboxylate transport system permease small subunit